MRHTTHLDSGDPVHANVKQSISQESSQVIRQEVKVQSDDALSPPVVEHLRIEGDWPSQKIDPAYHCIDGNQGIAMDNTDSHVTGQKAEA